MTKQAGRICVLLPGILLYMVVAIAFLALLQDLISPGVTWDPVLWITALVVFALILSGYASLVTDSKDRILRIWAVVAWGVVAIIGLYIAVALGIFRFSFQLTEMGVGAIPIGAGLFLLGGVGLRVALRMPELTSSVFVRLCSAALLCIGGMILISMFTFEARRIYTCRTALSQFVIDILSYPVQVGLVLILISQSYLLLWKKVTRTTAVIVSLGFAFGILCLLWSLR